MRLPVAGIVLAALAAGLCPPLAAQDSPPEAAPRPVPRVMPFAVRRNDSVRLAGDAAIDIPQEAKDAGHNGAARFMVQVDETGHLTGLELTRSSRSDAIDAAARDFLENRARFSRATDAEGNPVAGSGEVSVEYGMWDNGSPGGGIQTYTCASLVREADWFATVVAADVAAGDQPRIFPPENVYVGGNMLVEAQRHPNEDYARLQRRRPRHERAWAELVEECRSRPGERVLDMMDDPLPFVALSGLL